MDTTTNQIQPISPELINDLRAKYPGKLHCVTVEMGDGKEIEYILRTPGRSVFEAIARYKDDTTKANHLLVNNCVMAGDAEAFENDGAVYNAVMAEVAGIMKRKKTSIKKL